MICVVMDIPPVTNNDLDSPVPFDETNLGINEGTGNEDVYSLIIGTYVGTKHMVAPLLKYVGGCKTMENKFYFE